MFAVIRTGGKQYKVQKDDKIEVGKLDVEAGKTFDMEEVLFIGNDKTSTIGAPFIAGAKVVVEVLAQKRAPKIIVFKKKRRQNYRRKKGHRQDLTLLQIKEIKAA
ncbi:MAG: 50S ribosomal protein L21 [Alphaproteobacteria bacterium]|nr:50S ribosomal protein L21 [Alphaproteobacteria bacterium]